jgi:hypothetical protein
VRGDGSSDGPVYNDLKAAVGPNGEFLLTFKGYTPPNEKFQWIVKAIMVEPKDGQVRAPIVMFRQFRADGIVLSITDGGAQLPPDVVGNLAVMTEISRYEAN